MTWEVPKHCSVCGESAVVFKSKTEVEFDCHRIVNEDGLGEVGCSNATEKADALRALCSRLLAEVKETEFQWVDGLGKCNKCDGRSDRWHMLDCAKAALIAEAEAALNEAVQ